MAKFYEFSQSISGSESAFKNEFNIFKGFFYNGHLKDDYIKSEGATKIPVMHQCIIDIKGGWVIE